MIMSELSSPRRHGKQRSHAVINRAIGAGLFAAGIGLCVVLSHAPAQSSVEVEADSADNTVSRSIRQCLQHRWRSRSQGRDR